jgi:hypothetical protein
LDRPADARKVWPNSYSLLKEFAPGHLLTQLTIAEILRLVLEQADSVHTLVGLEQCLQLPLDLRCQRPAEQTGNAQEFAGDSLTDHTLQVRVV